MNNVLYDEMYFSHIFREFDWSKDHLVAYCQFDQFIRSVINQLCWSQYSNNHAHLWFVIWMKIAFLYFSCDSLTLNHQKMTQFLLQIEFLTGQKTKEFSIKVRSTVPSLSPAILQAVSFLLSADSSFQSNHAPTVPLPQMSLI